MGCKRVSKAVYDQAQALADRLNAEGADPDSVEVEAAAHPEGRKRGGTVSLFVEGEARVFYDELDETWVGYDDLRYDDEPAG